jgi:hypothetical protein
LRFGLGFGDLLVSVVQLIQDMRAVLAVCLLDLRYGGSVFAHLVSLSSIIFFQFGGKFLHRK